MRPVAGQHPVREAGMSLMGVARQAVVSAMGCRRGVLQGSRVPSVGDVERAHRATMGGVAIFDHARDATGVPDVCPMALLDGVLDAGDVAPMRLMT